MLKHSLSEAVSELKKNWLKILDPTEIGEVCREYNVTWRERVLSPATTVQLLLLQILHGNTAITHLRFFTARGFSASAYCQARFRLPVAVLQTLLARMTGSIRQAAERTWNKRRLFFVDGSTFSMPDTTELREHFGQPTGQKRGCGFPVAHFLALMHAGNGLIQEVVPGALFSHDLPRCIKLHPTLKRGDVIVGDRGFCSFAHLALLLCSGVDAVFRLHQAQIVNFRAGRRHCTKEPAIARSRWEQKLGIKDQLVTWFKPVMHPLWMTEAQYRALPTELLLRELAYEVHQRGFRVRRVILVTTLLDQNEFPKEVLAEAYRRRWRIETNFNHLKTTMRMDVLRCRSVDGVLRELYAYCIIYNVVCTVMMHEAESLGCAPERISFIDALRWLISACQTKCRIPLLLVPDRSHRFEPRAVKRRPKSYDLLVKPRRSYKLSAQYA